MKQEGKDEAEDKYINGSQNVNIVQAGGDVYWQAGRAVKLSP